MSELSAYIKEKRASRDFSVRKLAELADISHTEVKRIEDGVRKQPSPEVLRSIATALNVPYDEIMAAAGYVDAPYYTEIAENYRNNEDFEKALEYYEKALSIAIETHGEEHKSAALMYANLGTVHFEMSNFEACLMYLLKALTITEKLLGEKHPETVALYNNLAMAYKNRGDDESADKYIAKILAAHEIGHTALHSHNESKMLKAAGVGDADGLTESELADVEKYIQFIKSQRKE